MNKNVDLSKKKRRITPELFFRILVILVWTQNTILTYVIQIIRRIPLVGFIYPYVIPVSLVVMVMFSLPYMTKKIRGMDIVGGLLFVSLLLISILFFPKNVPYIQENLIRILLYSFPMFFVGICYSHELSEKDLFWSSIIGAGTVMLYQVYMLLSGQILSMNSMNAAYEVLPSVLYVIYWAFTHLKIRYWICATASVVFIFVFGTRAPVLIVFVFILLQIYFVFIRPKAWYVKIGYLVFLVIFVGFFSSSAFYVVVEYISEKFSSIGYSTRIFDLILNGELAYDNGRNRLHEIILSAIRERPILGYGIMGDRVMLDIYAHNLVLELWCDFGVLFGSIILLIVVSVPLFAMIKSRDIVNFGFVVLFVCLVFIKLMFSGSYLIEPYFYLLMGLSINTIRQARLNRENGFANSL